MKTRWVNGKDTIPYEGSYIKVSGVRVKRRFVLSTIFWRWASGPKIKRYYDSVQEAKADGWRKL